MVPGSPLDGPVLGLMPCFFPPRMLQPGAPPFFFLVFSQLPLTLQSVAPGLPPDDPVRGLAPCFIPPRMLPSGASFCRTLSAAVCTVTVLVPASLFPLLAPPYDSACPVSDAPVHATGASAVPFPPVPFLTSGSSPARGGGVPVPGGAGAGGSSGEGHGGVAHRRAPKGMGRQGAAPVQEGGSPQAGELETNMLCRHRGQAGLDGDLWEDTAAAVCSEGHTRQYVGVSAG